MGDERRALIERHTVNDAWAMNTYLACDIRCVYCITSAQGKSLARFGPAEVGERLATELDAIGHPDRLVVGPYCDVYPGPEAQLMVTRRALEVLVTRSIDFRLVTKGTTVVRDADLFTHPKTQIQISLNTVDEGALSHLEPGSSSAADRIEVLHRLDRSGVRTVLQVSPWIPGISDLVALLSRVDPKVVVSVTPLRLPPNLTRARREFGCSQADVNDAYRREYERVGPRPNLRWSQPPSLDGAPPHISSNLGRRRITDWQPSPPAPDPGLPRWW